MKCDRHNADAKRNRCPVARVGPGSGCNQEQGGRSGKLESIYDHGLNMSLPANQDTHKIEIGHRGLNADSIRSCALFESDKPPVEEVQPAGSDALALLVGHGPAGASGRPGGPPRRHRSCTDDGPTDPACAA
jgi:hypothetical protein